MILELEGLSLSLDFSVKFCDIIMSFLPEFYLTMGMMILALGLLEFVRGEHLRHSGGAGT